MSDLTTSRNEFGIIPRTYHRETPRWYHSHIIDWMMANPGGKLEDCAAFVHKRPATLSAIIRSDMFQAALAKRKQEFADQQNHILAGKLTKVAAASLDTILAVIEQKKNAIPLETLDRIANTTLTRLGYGVEKQQPIAAVNVNVNQNNLVQTPVALVELEAARALMREHQQKIAGSLSPNPEPRILPTAGVPSPPIDAEFSEVPSEKGAAPVNSPKREG